MSLSKVFRATIYLAITALVVWLVRAPLGDVLAARSRLSEIPVWAWVLMAALEIASFGCIWVLFKAVLPNVGLRAIAISQLVSNAASRVIPGGAATGGAVQYRVLRSAGVDSKATGGALLATAILTFASLFAISGIAGCLALVYASVGGGLLWGAFVGPVLLVLTVGVCWLLVRTHKPLVMLAGVVDSIALKLAGLFSFSWVSDPNRFVTERDRLLEALRNSWRLAVFAAFGKWLLDCAVLLVGLYAVGERPTVTLVVLAFCASSVLAMIPITPGGFGVVEVGLTELLVSSGVGKPSAELAVFVFRLMSFWLPIAMGLLVWPLVRYLAPDK